MKGRGGLAILICALALLALPGSAVAKPGYYVSSHLHYAIVHLKGSNGYQLRIEGFSTNVNVEASKGPGEVEYTVYRARLRNDRIRARLPGIGRINLRFHELSRNRKAPDDNCKGPGELVRRGIFRGTIEIEGELGYTRVNARSARGRILDDPEQICRRQQPPGARASAEPEEETIEAATMAGNGVLWFEASEWSPFAGSQPVFFRATTYRRRGMMVIMNGVGGIVNDPKAIAIAKPPLSALVTPPTPFTGTAEFKREPGGGFGWLGDLAADLPGIGPVALAGPDFEARACDGRNCKGSVRLSKYPFRGPVEVLP